MLMSKNEEIPMKSIINTQLRQLFSDLVTYFCILLSVYS